MKNFHTKDPMKKIAEAWIANVDCNVCIVDWRPLSGDSGASADFSDLSKLVEYEKVASIHTVTTSNTIHRFLEFLGNKGMNIKDVSMAGHR